MLKACAAAYGALGDRPEYNPDDFFPTTPWEDVSGVRLEYRVRRGSQVASHSLRKRTTRWRGMPDRPDRQTYYLDISRTQPVDTLIGYGRVARTELAKSADEVELSAEYRGSLSRVLDRTYDSSSIVKDQRGKQVGIVSRGDLSYSNFHQGAGEDATADLMALLEAAPRNSLILIDEVEASLHPRAQRRLVTELVSIATSRRLQLVLSTHSQYVLEQLPAEARIYLRVTRDGSREPIYGVTPSYALSLMDDDRHPDLTLYCEDERAAGLVEGILRRTSPEDLERLQVLPVGPAGTVRVMGDLSARAKFREPGLGVLDGDQGAAPGCINLPGLALPPERAVIESMNEENLVSVAERLGERPGDLMDAHEDAIRLDDHHAWPRRVAERLSGTTRATRVWEAYADVWIRDILLDEEVSRFADRVNAHLPQIEKAQSEEGRGNVGR